jgi:hypothetical protein
LSDKWTFETGATHCNYATSCNPGQHWDKVQQRCVDCEKGEYAPHMNMDKCLGCPVGKYQFRRGQNSCQAITCQPGQYMAETYNKCLSCTVGEWSKTGKLTYCYKCPRGYYNYETGQTECKKSYCTAGTYQSRLAIPKLNSTGFAYSEMGDDGVVRKAMTTCHKCPQGTYQPLDGMFYCFKCKAGKFATSRGMTSCSSSKSCVKLSSRLYCPAKQRKMLNPYTCQNVKCRISHYKDFHGTVHRRMQVIHVPGHPWFNDQEPAEKRIQDLAKENGWDKDDPHAMWTAHHMCKSDYAHSTKPTEKERLEDCNCICW